jgi:hypothetical protein
MTSRRAPYLLFLPALLLAASALAQTRPIPDEAKRGLIRHDQEMAVTVDGMPMRLAPGAVIRNAINLIVVPTAMPREGAWADFTMDNNGQIFRVWLLTPAEMAKPRTETGGR